MTDADDHKLRPGRKSMVFLFVIFMLWLLEVSGACARDIGNTFHVAVTETWEGYSRPGSTTEIATSIYAQQGGAVEVGVQSGNQSTLFRVDLEAEKQQTLWIPLRPAAQPDADIRISGPSHRAVQAKASFHMLPGDAVIIALAVAGNHEPSWKQPENENLTLLKTATRNLPHNYQAYETIDGLMLDATGLADLGNQQLSALAAYFRSCGRVAVIGANRQVAAALSENAGCDGAFVKMAEDFTQAIAWLEGTLNQHPPVLPDAARLASLLNRDKQSHPLTSLGIFVLLYFILLIFMARLTRRPLIILSIPVLATMALIIFSSTDTPDTRFQYWTEMNSGESHARFAALMQTTGSGPRQILVNFPQALGLPRTEHAASPQQRIIFRAGQEQADLELTTHLFSQDEYYWQGSVSLESPVTLSLQSGTPSISNPAMQWSPPGFLHWQGTYFAFPGLAPGKHWSPDDGVRLSSAVPPVEISLSRMTDNETALLLPYLSATFQHTRRATGWLLIREGSVS